MTVEVADISGYQADSLDFMKQLSKYAQSIIVKLTEGSEDGLAYVNPKAFRQISNGFKVVPTVGVYHYFRGNSQKHGKQDPENEAKWFIKNIKLAGLDKSTVCVLDVEDATLMANVTADVNVFIDYMLRQGYRHLVVYASASWFNSKRINRQGLCQQVYIWVAAYGVDRPGVEAANAWQYTDNGHGLHVDFSYDFDGSLVGQ